MIKAVVFDFNGVFARPIELEVVSRICDTKGVDKWIALSNYFLNIARFELGYLPPAEFWKKVFVDLTHEEYLAYVEAEYGKRLPRNEGLYSLCDRLSKKYALYCISNSNFLQGKAYRKQKLYSPFNELFLSHETGKLKPLLGAYTNFLEKTGFVARECVYIDDSFRNIIPALALGFHGIKYENNEGLESRLRGLGVRA